MFVLCQTATAGARIDGPVPTLRRGVSIDRQVNTLPPNEKTIIHRDDLGQIKAMGFDHVKMIVNPDVFKRGGDLDPTGATYLDTIVQFAVDEGLPAVLCVHPKAAFKQRAFNDTQEFAELVGFFEALSEHIAARWSPRQVVLQLMTEPFAASDDRNAWNHWDALQRRLWAAARARMPHHLLILSGDKVGSIEGLFDIEPVDDENVLYSFSFYDPQVFTQQGFGPVDSDLHYLRNLPYPSGPETLAAMPQMLADVPDRWKPSLTERITHYSKERWDNAKLAATIGRLAEWRNVHGGKPRVWCGEFGCFEAAPRNDRLGYLCRVRELLEIQCAGWCYWSFNESFTTMDADRKTPDRELLNALMPNSISLAGSDWRIQADYEATGQERELFNAPIDASGWISSRVPGNIQADVEAAHIVGPFWYGGVSSQVSDIARRDWWCRKDFTIPAGLQDKRLTLAFDGVDDRCKVWLNGKLLGANSGMFNRFSFDVSDCVRPGEVNRLAVWIARMPEELAPMLLGSDGPNNGPVYGLPDRARHVLKNFKTPGSMGFDWSPNLWTLGIWRDVRLEAAGQAKILSTRVESRLNDSFNRATIHVSLDVDCLNAGQYDVVLHISGQGANVSKKISNTLSEGRNSVEADLALDGPALWWPSGQGEQPLYTLNATIQPVGGSVSHSSSTPFGVRDIRWVETLDPTRSSGKDILTFTGRELRWEPATDAKPDRTSRLQLMVNGRPVRMMGTALTLPGVFPGLTTLHTQHLLRCAKAAGMNTLRLNGGGGGPLFDDAWYAMADRLGIMIAYEYPVANTVPDADPETLANLGAACRDMIRRTRNHPCIIEYVAGSEMGMIGKDFDALDNAPFMLLARRIAAEESDRIFRLTSPELGTKHGPWDFLLLPPKQPAADEVPTRPKLQTTGYQYYDGNGGDTMRYGEFGTASPANLEVWQRMIPPASQWPLGRVDDPVLVYHNATKACFTDVHWLFKPWIDEAFGPLDNLREVVAAGQYYGAEGLRYIFDALRRKGRRIGGMTSHCFSEPWPNAAGSFLVDSDGRPLMNLDFLKQALAPISISLKIDSALYDAANGTDVPLFLTSDAPLPEKDLIARWVIRDCHGGILDQGDTTAAIDPLEVKQIGTIRIRPRKETACGPILVELRLEDAEKRLLTERVQILGSSSAQFPLRGLLKNTDGSDTATCCPVRRTALEVVSVRSGVDNGDDLLFLELKNTGEMTALFCEPHPMLVYRTDLLIENRNGFIPPGETRTITIRAPRRSESGLSLTQTGWTITTWNADDVPVPPDGDVLLSVGRWDRMCQEFQGCSDRESANPSADASLTGRRPDASAIPYRLSNAGEVAFAFELPAEKIGRSARLRIHTADQSPTPVRLNVTVNGSTFTANLPKGLGVQQTAPSHLAFPATATFDLSSTDLHVGENNVTVRVSGDGWFSWDALDCAIPSTFGADTR